MGNAERDGLFGTMIRFTALATLVGAPSLSMPLGRTSRDLVTSSEAARGVRAFRTRRM